MAERLGAAYGSGLLGRWAGSTSAAAEASGDEEAEVFPPDALDSEQATKAPVDPDTLGPVTVWLAGDSTVANGQTP